MTGEKRITFWNTERIEEMQEDLKQGRAESNVWSRACMKATAAVTCNLIKFDHSIFGWWWVRFLGNCGLVDMENCLSHCPLELALTQLQIQTQSSPRPLLPPVRHHLRTVSQTKSPPLTMPASTT